MTAQANCEYGSPKFYALCGIGGVLSCGITHTAIVPLDLVKCRIQVDKPKYKNLFHGLRLTVAEEGVRALGKGWAPTAIGYSMQGLGKFGFYEENAYLWRTSLYLAASASAEFLADIMLCPMEAVKVRIQTMPGWSNTLREGVPKMYRDEGIFGFYKGLPPLWGRQIPYTMMKFACFERTVEAIYHYVVPRPRDQCTKSEQLVVTFAAGYIGKSSTLTTISISAGVFCAIVSHPLDTIVSKLNKDPNARLMEVTRNLGLMGMWSGIGPRILMIGTLTALQWFVYDGFKVAMRLPRPPPPQMPESLRQKLNKE